MAMKSLEYSLPAMTLSKEDCVSITWPMFKSILPKAGINRYFPREALFGTHTLNGMGFKDIFLLQGISHVSYLVSHCWSNSITGHLIKQCLQLLRLEVGLSGDFLNREYNSIEPIILTNLWVQHLWHFMTLHGIQVQIDIEDIKPRRIDDVVIMEKNLDSKIASNSELKAVNKCRLYLRAFTLSDITSADGKYLRKSAMNGTRDTYSYSQIQWLLWGKPAPKSWTAWRRILRLVFTDGSSLQLVHPLSSWFHNQLSDWKWYLSADGNRLLQRKKDHWVQHRKRSGITRSTMFHSIGIPIQAPNIVPLQPTTASLNRDVLRTSGPIRIAEDNSNSQNQLVHKLHPSNCSWLFHCLQKSPSILVLLHDLKEGLALASSDGSYCKTPTSQLLVGQLSPKTDKNTLLESQFHISIHNVQAHIGANWLDSWQLYTCVVSLLLGTILDVHH